MINRAPEIDHLVIYLDVDLVQVPMPDAEHYGVINGSKGNDSST